MYYRLEQYRTGWLVLQSPDKQFWVPREGFYEYQSAREAIYMYGDALEPPTVKMLHFEPIGDV